MTDIAQLLPPNATGLERALEQATARVGDVATPIVDLWDPWTCPAELLPWLAWALSVDRWESSWPEPQKRAAIAASIEMHRHKGTRYSVESVLASFDELLQLVEWWEVSPRRAPHTFDVVVALDHHGGDRSTATFAEEIVREVSRVKPTRSHMRLVQSIEAAGMVGIVGAARTAAFVRYDVAVTVDTSQPWTILLQDQNGEPLQSETGAFLEDGQ